MDKAKMNHYKTLLLQHKERILTHGILSKKDDIQISADEGSEEGDIAANLTAQNVSFKLREKEMWTLKAIDAALYRMEEGTYGCCEDCGEDINEKRLSFQPWADMCIVHAEEQERNNARVS